MTLTSGDTLAFLAPGDDGHDAARTVHNGLVDRRPALIARCRSAADVVAALARARAEAYDRLVEFKRRWDPENVFHHNHNVAP